MRVATSTSQLHTEKTMNHRIFLVFLILFKREVPSHIFALHYPKFIEFLAIRSTVHGTTLQAGTTRSLLPDRNPLRKVSFPMKKEILTTYS